MLRIEHWYELNNNEYFEIINPDTNKIIISNLYLSTLIWNSLVDHFVSFLKSKDEVDFGIDEVLTIANYIASENSLPDNINKDLINNVCNEFENLIHNLYSGRVSQGSYLRKINIYDVFNISKNIFTLEEKDNIKTFKFNNNDVLFNIFNNVKMPANYLSIKVKYSVIENKDQINIAFV